MSKRGKKLALELGVFLKQYARKANRNIDPNDRNYDRKIEQMVKRMDPEELDRLMREDFEGLDDK